MSHAATKWAFDQPELFKDMKPAEWAVLMVLADCHNPVNGCYPSQDYICKKTNLSERSVRDQLGNLRDRGLINWELHHEEGRRGWNRYRLGFEPDFLPANPAGSSTGKIEQPLPANPDTYYRQDLPPNPVIEPVTEPPQPPEGAGRRGFDLLWAAWPMEHLPDSREAALKQFLKLSDVEQAYAVEQAMAYARLCALRLQHPRMITYFKERRFLELIDAPELDADGDWIITPKRPEWKEWMGVQRKKHGQPGVDYHVRLGRIVTKTRWPEGAPNGQKV